MFYASICIPTFIKFVVILLLYTGQFISPSGISELCGTVAGMVTPKVSVSTEEQTLQVSALPYRCSISPHLVTRQMSILTHVARVWQELDYRTDIFRITKGGHIEYV